MAFVPGFEHDVFISYAHGDDRDWINRFIDCLKPSLSGLLPDVNIWIDEDNLRKSRNFEQDIPSSLASAAVLLSLVSPTYIRRPYCVHHECHRFSNLAAARKQPGKRFASPDFAADLFGFRCPILPLPDAAYRNDIFPGTTDIPFFKDVRTLRIGTAPFERQLDLLVRELLSLLSRMRNHSTPVVLYPRLPAPELEEAHSVVARQLHADSFRILPDNELDPIPHVRRCELAVLLLGANYDETTRRLVDELKRLDKPFVVWPSPTIATSADFNQRGFFQYVRGLECARKTLLAPLITAEKLKQEVLAILDPQAKLPPAAEGKPQVYLIYDPSQNGEIDNAASIEFRYRDEFHFQHSDNPRQHNPRLTQSDGVLLVWGEATEKWCSDEFEQMIRLSNRHKSRGLCLFDPRQSKVTYAKEIHSLYSDIYIAEQFGSFDQNQLEPFFAPLRRSEAARA